MGGQLRGTDIGGIAPGNGTPGSFVGANPPDADFGGLPGPSIPMTVDIVKQVKLHPRDPLPPLPDGIGAPTASLEFNDGIRTNLYFDAEDFWVEMWQTYDGTYNSIDDGGRGNKWPASWTEEQVEDVREYASQLHQNVDIDAYTVSGDVITGDVAAAILANAVGADHLDQGDELAIGERGAQTAAKHLAGWVDVSDDPETYVGDALADLFHLLKKHNVDVSAVMASSFERFEDEVAHPF